MDKPSPLKDPRFVLGEEVSDGELYTMANGVGGVSAQAAPGREGESQDAAGLIPLDKRSCVLVIADGVGGQRQGSKASRIAVEKINQAVKKVIEGKAELREAVLDGFEKANQAIMDLGVGAATTLSVVRIRDKTMRWYHVGDSLVLLVGQKGKEKFQTVAHSPVGYAVESGMLDEKEAMHHEERHVVSNVLGSPDMSIEIGSEIEMDPNDTLLLATDGLSDNLRTEEIVEIIRKGSLESVIQDLSSKGRARMLKPAEGKPSKPDDMTFILYRLGE